MISLKKETEKMFIIFSSFAFMVTLILSLMNNKFIPSCMLMLSLLLFCICYMIKDTKKIVMYILFMIGVGLIIGSLVYTGMRIL